MLYWRHPLKSRCADKYDVRSYVEENGLGHLLIDLLGVYDSGREIDFGALPETGSSSRPRTAAGSTSSVRTRAGWTSTMRDGSWTLG